MNWVPIIGFEERYEVSELGEIRSLIKIDSRGQKRKPGLLKPSFNYSKNGLKLRVRVTLMDKNNKRVNCSVHRIVIESFLGKCPDGMIVCHNNGNAFDNHLSNLRFDTYKSNCKDQIIHGTTQRGEKNIKSKLTKDQVVEIKKTNTKGYGNLKVLADKYDVSSSTIWCIKNNRQWSWV